MSSFPEIIQKNVESWLPPAELSKEAEPLLEEFLDVLLKSPLFLQALGKCWKNSYWSSLLRGIVMREQIYFESKEFGYTLVEYGRIKEEGRNEKTLSIKRDTFCEDKGEETPQEIVEIKLGPIEAGAWKRDTSKVLYYKYRFPGDQKPPEVFFINSQAAIKQVREFLRRMKTELQPS